jgi:two-component system, cell cycle response regulator DivK
MHKKIILVVDDDAAQRRIFSKYLQFTGFRVMEAADGEEGLKMAGQHAPSLILLDIAMPVMDGWETMGRLREDAQTAEIPTVALTGFHLEPEQLWEAGFCGYLEKPIQPFRVLEEVEACIGPRRTQRARSTNGEMDSPPV